MWVSYGIEVQRLRLSWGNPRIGGRGGAEMLHAGVSMSLDRSGRAYMENGGENKPRLSVFLIFKIGQRVLCRRAAESRGCFLVA